MLHCSRYYQKNISISILKLDYQAANGSTKILNKQTITEIDAPLSFKELETLGLILISTIERRVFSVTLSMSIIYLNFNILL